MGRIGLLSDVRTAAGRRSLPSSGGAGQLPANVAKAKAAAATAPTTVAAIATRAGPVATMGNPNDPPTLYDYNRYWITGEGRNNGGGGTDNPLLQIATFVYNFANWSLVYGGGVTNNMNDGSSAEFWYGSKDQGGSPPMIGLRTNSRYLSFTTNQNGEMHLVVDGAVVLPGLQFDASNQTATWDFGSNAVREIVLIGGFDTWVAELYVEATATIEPYDFTVDYPVTVAFTGDSYLGHGDVLGSGLTFMDMMTRMIGGMGIAATHRGGTGYESDSGGGDDAKGSSPVRIARLVESQATVIAFQLGINDPWPEDTPAAMTLALEGARAGSPESIIVVMGPWAPMESVATEPGGSYLAKMDTLAAITATLSGPWVLLDNIRGDWTTSKGTSRGSLRGPWQTGDGNLGAPTGTGNGDTWINADGTHPSTPVGITGLSQIWAAELRAALASF